MFIINRRTYSERGVNVLLNALQIRAPVSQQITGTTIILVTTTMKKYCIAH